jgi:hemolysin III
MVTSADSIRFNNREDKANAISHLAGTFLSVAALVIMVVFSAAKGSVWHIVSSSVFGASMIILYLSSTIAHWLPAGKTKDSFFTLDQAAIFILIAGTYTPLTLITLRGTLGWILFGIEWSLAIFGIFRLFRRNSGFEDGVGIIDILIYIVMGWMVILFSGAILRSVPVMGFVWIVIGGLFYTLGVIFYKVTKFRYHHLIWHIMVLGGTVSHFTAIFFYILR